MIIWVCRETTVYSKTSHSKIGFFFLQFAPLLLVYGFVNIYFVNRFVVEKINTYSIEILYLLSVRGRQSFRIKRENITPRAYIDYINHWAPNTKRLRCRRNRFRIFYDYFFLSSLKLCRFQISEPNNHLSRSSNCHVYTHPRCGILQQADDNNNNDNSYNINADDRKFVLSVNRLDRCKTFPKRHIIIIIIVSKAVASRSS